MNLEFTFVKIINISIFLFILISTIIDNLVQIFYLFYLFYYFPYISKGIGNYKLIE